MKLGAWSLLEASALGLSPRCRAVAAGRTLAALSRRRSGSDFCLLPSSFCLLPSHSAVGGSAGRRGRAGLGGERNDQVLAGLGVVRLESQGCLELADGLGETAPLVKGAAQGVVGLGVIRLQAQGFVQLADRLVGL